MKIVQPLRNRDFALLTSAHAISLFGDGIYFVAVIWQVYELSNSPMALSLAGIAWTIPYVTFSLFGGVLTDRVDRRHVMVAGDLIRLFAIGALATITLSGGLELWHIYAVSAVYAVGDALFAPAHGAIVPDLVPPRHLVAANSLGHFLRPLAVGLAGPAVGGFVIAGYGTGIAFAADAATFAISAALLLGIRRQQRTAVESSTALREITDGLRFIRGETWLLWALVASTVTVLVMWGPWELLLPYLLKNELGGGPDDVGIMFAAGGAGAILAALIVAHGGLPRRDITVMYVTSALSVLGLVAYAGATASWHVFATACVTGLAGGVSGVIWASIIHLRVPAYVRGRVMSVAGLATWGLLPLSYALTGPVHAALGTRPTLLAAGVAGTVVVMAFYLIPSARTGEGVARFVAEAEAAN